MRTAQGAFPQIRMVGLAECGTHAIVDAVIGRYTDAEQRLVPGLFGSFVPGMLVSGRPGLLQLRSVESGPRNRSRSVVADQVQPRLGRRAAPRRRLVPLVDLPEPKGPPQPHQRAWWCV